MPMPKYSPGRKGINNSKINLKWLKYILVIILTITLLKMGLIHFVGMNLKNIVVTYRQIPQEYQVDTKWNVEIDSAPVCKNGDLLFLVKTARKNKILRELVRKSHKLQTNVAQIDSQLLFIIGQTDQDEDSNIQTELKAEIAEFQDFIIGNFVDSYHNLTKKTFVAHKYAAEKCDSNLKIIFQDDDVVINYSKYKKINLDNEHINCLNNLRNINAEVLRVGSFSSYFWNRKLFKKYAQTKDEYSLDIYPPYCAGACQSFTAEYARLIYEQARVTNPGIFLHDDVFFSGVLREKAKLDIPNKVRGICHFGTGTESAKDLEKILEKIITHYS
jgi:hypothetical protein